MYKLRLILKGVIFLTMAKDPSGQDQLWLLLLDPGHTTAVHHQAHLYIDKSVIDPVTRDFDGAHCHGAVCDEKYFDLSGDHLTLLSTRPTNPSKIEFIKNTRPVGAAKPCTGAGCSSPLSFKEQRNDIHWTNALTDILQNIPLKSGRKFTEATKLRDDVLQKTYFKDGLILARIAIPAGKVRTYTLWGEGGDESNSRPESLFTYVFKEPWIECLTDQGVAVAEIVVIELETDGAITLSSRSLADGTLDENRDIVTKTISSNLDIVISSMRHDTSTREGDFGAYYQLLMHPEYFHYLPLPKACEGGDSGGACSPATRERP